MAGLLIERVIGVVRQSAIKITYIIKTKISGKIRKPSEEVKKLTAELKDDNLVVRKAAVKALDDLGWQPDQSETGAAYWIARCQWEKCVEIGAPAVRPLVDYFENKNCMYHQKVAEALGQLGDAQAVEPLIAALKDESKWFRDAVAESLGKIGDVRAVESLVGILEDESPVVRRRAAEALDRIGWQPDENKAGAQYWTVKSLYDDDENVRKAAAGALDRTSWQPDQSETGAAYWVLRRQWDKCVEIGAPAVRPLFITLQDDDENVRKAAAGALVQIGKPAVELLVSALEKYYMWTYTDASSLVLRITATNVLGKIGDPRAIKVLIAMGSKIERTLEHRKAAANALARIGEPAFETLIGMLQDDEANLQQLAAWSLGKIGDTRAVEPLIPILSSTPYHYHYPHARQAAQEALKAITGQDFGGNVGRWEEWSKGFASGHGPHTDQVNAVAVTLDGRWAVSCSRDLTIKVWDIESGELVATYAAPREVNSITVTPDGKKILFGTGGKYVSKGLQVAEIDSKVNLWDLESGEEIASFRHDGGVYAVAITPDGRRVVSGSGHGNVKVWNLESGEEEVTFGYDKLGVSGVYSIAITPDGRWVVSGSGHSNVKVWNLESGKEEVTFSGHDGVVNAVAITPDGRWVVSGSKDKTLKLWDLASGEELATLSGHAEEVNAIAVTSDGQFAISASSDKSLKIWDLTRKSEIHTLKGHTEEVCTVAITSDGKYILSASADKTLKMWNLDHGEEVCTFTGRQSAERK